MQNLMGLADVLELWVSANPKTRSVPIAARSEVGNTYLMAVPVRWSKPYPFYEVYFMQQGKKPEKIVFPDLRVPREMVTTANSGKFEASDLTVTSEAQFQEVSFVGLDVISRTMTGGAGSEWTHRRWRVDWTSALGVSPSLTKYTVENVQAGYSVDIFAGEGAVN